MSSVVMLNVAFVIMGSLCMAVHAMSEDAATEKKITSLVVRAATLDDLDGVYAVDKEVTFEHFLPLMTEHYPQVYGNKTVKEGLEGDLAADVGIFKRCVTEQGDKRLHVAYDTEKKCVTGFLLSSKKDRVVNIDLLFVVRASRQQGAAKKLFTEVIQTLSDVDQCYFYALDKNKEVLKCIEKLGIECTPVNEDQKIDSGAPAMLYKHYTVAIAVLKAKLANNK